MTSVSDCLLAGGIVSNRIYEIYSLTHVLSPPKKVLKLQSHLHCGCGSRTACDGACRTTATFAVLVHCPPRERLLQY